jgi:hypothetical protein
MIAVWMLYSLAVTTVLLACGMATEYLARALGRATRFVWAATIVTAITLPGFTLARRMQVDPHPTAPVPTEHRSTIPVSPHTLTFADRGSPRARAAMAPEANDRALAAHWRAAVQQWFTLRRALTLDATDGLVAWDRRLVLAWATLSTLTLVYWLVGVGRIRRMARRFTATTIDGTAVWVSPDLGPAVFGVLRFRIVVPPWVLALPGAARQTILAHEREHVRAADPLLVYAAYALVALQPWNLILWYLVARLRFATEVDCDRRVIARATDPRSYSSLLLTAYERSSALGMPLSAFLEPRSHLERRIHRMLARQPRLVSLSTGMAIAMALCLAVTAFTVPRPVRTARVGHDAPTAFEGVVTYQADWNHQHRIVRYSVNGTKIRSEVFAPELKALSTVIYDGASHTAYWLTTWDTVPARVYSTLPTSQNAVIVTKNSHAPALVSRVGAETIAGIRCDDYEGIDDGGEHRYACLMPGMGTFPLFAPMSGRGQVIRPAGPFRDLFARGYFPLAVGTIDGGARTVDMVATTVERKHLDTSLFVVPPGYRYISGLFRSPIRAHVLDAHRIVLYENLDTPVVAMFLAHTVDPVADSVARHLAPMSDVALRHNDELLLEDPEHRNPAIVFSADNDSNDHLLSSQHPDAVRILITGLDVYLPGPISANAVGRLRPTEQCHDAPRGSCYEADGLRIIFPR